MLWWRYCHDLCPCYAQPRRHRRPQSGTATVAVLAPLASIFKPSFHSCIPNDGSSSFPLPTATPLGPSDHLSLVRHLWHPRRARQPLLSASIHATIAPPIHSLVDRHFNPSRPSVVSVDGSYSFLEPTAATVRECHLRPSRQLHSAMAFVVSLRLCVVHPLPRVSQGSKDTSFSHTGWQ
jgi:hypothetical protein